MKAKDIFQYVLAGIIVLGEIAMISFLLILWMRGTSTTDAAVVNLIYGVVLAYHSGFMLVLGYFFASTKGSAEKNDMVYNSMPTKPSDANTIEITKTIDTKTN